MTYQEKKDVFEATVVAGPDNSIGPDTLRSTIVAMTDELHNAVSVNETKVTALNDSVTAFSADIDDIRVQVPYNHSATTDPTTSDDGNNTSGNGVFSFTSKWLNTSSGSLFICESSATGAAAWTAIDFDGAALGALANLDTVNTSQIDDEAITEDKLAGGLELGGPSLGTRSVVRYNELVISADIVLWESNATCTADDTADTIDKGTDDGFADGVIVQFTTTGTLPAGLATETNYYVRDITASTLKVAATGTGAAINITDTGSGTHTIYKPINGSTVGPIEIADGVTIDVKSGSTWSVV